MSEKKYKQLLFLLCLIGYSCAYFCRLNFSAAMPEMLKQNILTKGEMGVISSLFFFCYGVGQLINGFLGDKISPKILLSLGLVGSSLCNVLVFFSQKYIYFSILWALNGIFQSMLWPPIIYMISKYYSPSEKNRFAKLFTIAVPIGTLLSYGSNMLWIKYFGFKYAFIISGMILLAVALMWVILSPFILKNLKRIQETEVAKSETEAIKTETEVVKTKPEVAKTGTQTKGFLKAFLISGMSIMLLPIAIHGVLKDSVTNWVPTFISEVFSASTSLSLILTMVLPVINLTGGFIAVKINEKTKSEVKTAVYFFAFATLISLVLLLFGKYSIIISILCLALLTNCMFGINVLTISLMPLRFSKYNKVSFVSGLLNSLAYLGCAVFNTILGIVVSNKGWNGAMLLWIIISLVALIFSLLSIKPWKKFSNPTR